MVRQHRAELGGGNRPSFVENPGYEHHFFEEIHVAIFPMRWSFSGAPQSRSMALRRFGPRKWFLQQKRYYLSNGKNDVEKTPRGVLTGQTSQKIWSEMTFFQILLIFCIGFLSSAKGLLSDFFFGPPKTDFPGNSTVNFQDFPEDSG